MPSEYIIKISCYDKEDAMRLGCQIHEQLIDNPNARSSYMNDNIKLSFIGQEGDVYLFIDDVDEVPEITLFKKGDKWAHKYDVKISCYDEESTKRLAYQIHDQLINNPDVYIDDKIMLTAGVATVFLFIDDVDEVPEITLFKKENK